MVDMNNMVKIEAALLDELKSVCLDGNCISEKVEIAIMDSLKKLGYS